MHVRRSGEPAPFGQARFRPFEGGPRLPHVSRVDVALAKFAAHHRKTGAAGAERTRYGEHVAAPSARARAQTRTRHLADDGYRKRQHGRTDDIAAGDRGAMRGSERGEAAITVQYQRKVRLGSDAECDGGEHRSCTHRRDVGQIRGHRAVPDRTRVHRARIEVHAVDQRVGRDHREVRTRRLPCSRIVADAEREPARLRAGRSRRFGYRPQRRDERVFGQRAPARSGASANSRSAGSSAAGCAAP